MNKFITFALCGTILLSLTACGANASDAHHSKSIGGSTESINTITADESVEIPNPLKEYVTLQEAETALGFKVTVPANLPEGYVQSSIYAIDNDMVQIIYLNGSSEICFRQGKGNEDISGDYNAYDEVTTETINGMSVTLKGNANKVNTAVWTDGDYSFSITLDASEEGIANEEMIAVISSVQ